MATKNNPGQYDCYAKAEPDEPMFVLLGRDRHAPTLVWLWTVLRELDGERPEKLKEARECALAMLQYKSATGEMAVGLGQAALAGVLELCRAANHTCQKVLAENNASDAETARAFFATTKFE